MSLEKKVAEYVTTQAALEGDQAQAILATLREHLPPEVDEALSAGIDEYFQTRERLQTNLDVLRADITSEVLEIGESVATSAALVVYNKGRVTWDGKGLVGYAVAHPEINQFKKVGKPTVSIRVKKKHDH